MADPTVTKIAGSTSATALTTVSFSAQPAGTLLTLHVSSDDYRTTTGSGRPESTGWTLLLSDQRNLGCYLWWKITDGSDTSVQYTIGSGVGSAHAVIAATNIDPSPTDTQAQNFTATGYGGTTHSTPSITPTTTGTNRRLVYGHIGAASSGALTGVSAWTNSFTEIADHATTAGYRDLIGVGYLIMDGGTSISTGATFNTTVDQAIGFTASFKVAAGGGAPALPPILIMQTRRP
jgi:hypothetical protein